MSKTVRDSIRSPLRRLATREALFWVVRYSSRPAITGARPFRFQAPRTEDDDGVWISAAANMRNWLILREKVRAFRADPEVKAALEGGARG